MNVHKQHVLTVYPDATCSKVRGASFHHRYVVSTTGRGIIGWGYTKARAWAKAQTTTLGLKLAE